MRDRAVDFPADAAVLIVDEVLDHRAGRQHHFAQIAEGVVIVARRTGAGERVFDSLIKDLRCNLVRYLVDFITSRASPRRFASCDVLIRR